MSKGSYAAALNAPFSEAALGAQIPDIFSYPTDTKHFRQSFTIKTDINGNWEGVLLPSPVFSVAAPMRCIADNTYTKSLEGGVDLFGADVEVPSASVVSGTSGNLLAMQVSSCAKVETLAGIFERYRVVGWGYKLRAITSVNATAGRVKVASIPAPRTLPDAAFLNNTGAARPDMVGTTFVYPQYDFYNSLFGNFGLKENRPAVIAQFVRGSTGIPSTFSGDLLDYPINVEVTSLQLASAPLRGHGKLMSRDFEKFRATESLIGYELVQTGGTDYLVFDTWSGATSAVATTHPGFGYQNTSKSSYMQSNDCSGWNCVLMSVVGAQALTTAFELELVYHVEGVNPISLGSFSPLGGKAIHHNPIEAMAAETVNAASGKYPCILAF